MLKKQIQLSVAIQQFERSKGFTLVEVLVATSIFVVVIAMAIGTFSNANVIQMQNQAIRETTQSGMYLIESLARDLHMSNGLTESPYILDGDTLTIRYLQNDVLHIKTYEYTVDENDRGTIIYNDDITNTDVDLLDENLSIKPFTDETSIFISDPYSPLNIAAVQPNLQIKFQISNNSARKSEQSTIPLETTITTRNYPVGFNQ